MGLQCPKNNLTDISVLNLETLVSFAHRIAWVYGSEMFKKNSGFNSSGDDYNKHSTGVVFYLFHDTSYEEACWHLSKIIKRQLRITCSYTSAISHETSILIIKITNINGTNLTMFFIVLKNSHFLSSWLWYKSMFHISEGARSSVVGWSTVLQVGRSQVRFPMRSTQFPQFT
jgi:hypothetical protein